MKLNQPKEDFPMKWYKKQLEMLNLTAAEATPPTAKTPGDYSFSSTLRKPNTKNFRNPVAESKRSRSKTDK